jgi:hypothetical protein
LTTTGFGLMTDTLGKVVSNLILLITESPDAFDTLKRHNFVTIFIEIL